MENKTFEKGQYIIYSTNGLCRIEDIQLMSFISDEEKKKHYIIKPLKGNASTIYVPADNQKLMSRLRPTMTKEEIDSLLVSIQGKEQTWEDDWKARRDHFHEILMNGVSADLLLMIGCIYMQKQALSKENKALSMADIKALENAEQLVEEEFTFVLGIDPSEVGKYIRKILGV